MAKNSERDPRLDPRPGDVVRMRNKTRRVTDVGPCVQGKPRVCYEQVTIKEISSSLKRWQEGTKFGEVINHGEE